MRQRCRAPREAPTQKKPFRRQWVPSRTIWTCPLNFAPISCAWAHTILLPLPPGTHHSPPFCDLPPLHDITSCFFFPFSLFPFILTLPPVRSRNLRLAHPLVLHLPFDETTAPRDTRRSTHFPPPPSRKTRLSRPGSRSPCTVSIFRIRIVKPQLLSQAPSECVSSSHHAYSSTRHAHGVQE